MDVFLSYNRADAPVARELDAWLRGQGVRSFLDTRELVSGQTWLPELERAITREAGAVAVLVGPSGLGNTQHYEHQLALVRQAREPGFPVIPVLLPGTPEWRFPRGFLELQTWVSFAGVAAPAAAPDALLRLLGAIRRERLDAAAVRAAICPYKGLEAFQEEDARIFFGRAEEAAQLHRTVVEGGVAAVIGRSGSGKSSLARAGLLPLLRRKGEAGWGTVWDRLVLRPGRYPLLALAEALEPGEPGQSRSERHAMHLRVQEELRRQSPDFVASLLHRQLEARERPVDRLLILLDQAEEMFARPIELTDAAEIARWQADAEALVALLVGAAARGPASLVLTIRSDYFDPLQHSAMGPLLSRAMVATRGVQDLRAAVEGPAALVGLRFAPGLVERVLRETGEDEGNLPLLQHALERSWKAREGEVISFAAYAASGGVEGAINQAAQGVYEALDAPGKAAAKRLFLRLVRPGEGRGHVRVRAPLPADAAERRVAEAFGAWNTRLLFFGEAGGVPTVEVAHEALIRGWGTLLEWVKENRERLAARDAVLDWMRNSPGELLQQGALLTRASELVRDPGDVGVEEIGPLVERSAKAVQTKRMVRLSLGAAAVLLVLGVSSGVWVREQQQALRLAAGRTEVAVLAEQQQRERAAVEQILAAAAREARDRAVAERADAVRERERAEREEAQADTARAEAERQAVAARDAQRRAEAGFAAARDAASSLIFDIAVGLRQRQGMPAALVRDLLNRAGRTLDALLAHTPDDTETLRLRGVAFQEFSSTFATLGDTSAQAQAARAGLSVFERLAAAHPGNAVLQHDLANSHDGLGAVLEAQGNLPGALAAYQAGMAIRQRLAAADPDHAGRQHDLSVSHERIGDVLMAAGDLPGALASYRAGMEIGARFAAADPSNARWQRGLSLSHNRIGDVLWAQGDLPAALAAYRAAMEIRQRLAATDPGNAEWLRDLSVSHERIGDVLEAQRDLPGALAAYRAKLEIAARLAVADPSNARWQRDLSVSQIKIGNLLRAEGNMPGALAAYRTAMEITARLAAADQGNAVWQRDLFVLHWQLADTLLILGQTASATQHAQSALAVARQRRERHPDQLETANDLQAAEALMRRVNLPLAQ